MKRHDVKSRCPFNFAAEVFGDPWSILILRDMAGIGKRTFSEFLDSPERIGRSVLAEKLAGLERKGIIKKMPSEKDKRVTIYSLTEIGLDVLPLMYEIGAWGSAASASPEASKTWFALLKIEKSKVLDAWRSALLSGSSLENGSNSAAKQLGL